MQQSLNQVDQFQDTADFLADAITSSNPPLSGESIVRIERITAARIESLVGGDRFAAAQVFALMERLPPIYGPRFQRLFTLMAETDFTPDALKNSLLACSSTKEDEKSELGFVEGAASFDHDQINRKIIVDEQRADRDGLGLLPELYIGLFSISDRDIRRSIIADCCAIADLRFHFTGNVQVRLKMSDAPAE